jgi:hypothetical protein
VERKEKERQEEKKDTKQATKKQSNKEKERVTDKRAHTVKLITHFLYTSLHFFSAYATQISFHAVYIRIY